MGFILIYKPSVEEREGSYAKLVNAYYELATLFYEWGWGSSFHFASRWRGESFQESIKVRQTKPWRREEEKMGAVVGNDGATRGLFEAMIPVGYWTGSPSSGNTKHKTNKRVVIAACSPVQMRGPCVKQ